ncbi:serine/threonine-protein kinase [Holophaga foetida]|uniref:serine/threonine-protein kinase n=1 Tax=Holophaga foetida TaxID=35839 RepID=UPI0002474D39|nr:serine/threonine-protein kinase [Holophaga foetida]
MDGQANEPRTVGRYEIKKLLGSGAMGSVYLAEDPRIKRKLAIKVVRLAAIRSETDRQDFLMRFQREAEVSGLLNDPGIVTIYDVGDSDVGPFMAMEFVPGRPLDALIKSGESQKMDLGAKLSLAAGIASALDHAHAHGIIHRDVKPGNVMLTEDGRPKLMDFGIAKREDANLTQTGTFLGTPAYASPEQIREGKTTLRSDIFSFGVLVFELLSGGLPFPGSSINTILYRIVNENPTEVDPPVLGLAAGAWQRIFSRVLAKSPEERYPTCGDFIKDLVDSVTGLGPEERLSLLQGLRQLTPSPVGIQISVPASRTPQEETSVARPHRSRTLPIVAGALVALAAGGFLLFRGKTGKTITLISRPPQAKVLREGKELGETPIVLPLKPGERLMIEHRGFEPQEFVYQKGISTELELRPIVRDEVLRTEPSGATVVMDSVPLKDRTPLTVSWDQGKKHNLTFTKDQLAFSQEFLEGETPGTRTFSLSAPQEAARPAEPQDPSAPAGLRLTGAFPVRIKIDGKDAGEMRPGAILKLAPGAHRLELVNARVFYRESRSLSVTPGQQVSLATPGLASLTVSTFPSSGMVTVDGITTSIESDGSAAIEVAKGKHSVGIAGHPASTRNVNLEADTTLKFKL